MTNGEGEPGHRLILGPGGSGKTTVLRGWIANAGEPVALITGRPTKPATVQDLDGTLASGARILAFDDCQWATDECLERITALSGQITIWAVRRPYPNPAPMMAVSDICTEESPAKRTSMLDVDTLGSRLAKSLGRPAAGDVVDSLLAMTLGSPALLSDIIEFGDLGLIGEEDHDPGSELVDQVVGRVRRCGAPAMTLANLLAFDNRLTMDRSVGALPEGVDTAIAERSLRASGLVGEAGELAPVVAECLLADMTVSDRRTIQSSLASSLGALDPVESARYLDDEAEEAPDVLLAAATSLCGIDNDQAGQYLDRVDVASCSQDQLRLLSHLAFRLGHEALDFSVERGSRDFPEAFSDLVIARQLRLLRWPLAATEIANGAAASDLSRLAKSLIGHVPGAIDGNQVGVPGMTQAVVNAFHGDIGAAYSSLTVLADDYSATDTVSATNGLTPHMLGALVGLLVGDSDGAALLLDEAIESEAGGAGEVSAAQRLRAFAALRQADYSTTIELASSQASPTDLRLRLLSAALVAGLARRSGDTSRMREAWAEADAVLSRPTASWLLTEILSELLLVGVKLGHERRVGEVLGELEAQTSTQPESSPGSVAIAWLRFQLAIQRADTDEGQVEAERMAAFKPSDPRSLARVAASALWVQSANGAASEAELLSVANELGRCGDRWEASRLLGSAALDVEDPDSSRRLLEAARSLSADLVDIERGDGLVALGLSEREAEVAQLVAEGKTYKEIGAQLYISPKTVEHHVARAKQKLGTTSRSEFRSVVTEAT